MSRDERRQCNRHGTWQQVEIENAGTEIIAELLDLSASGARLCIKNGLVPARGDAIAICLIDGTQLEGRVAWLGSDQIGVKFNIPLLNVDDYLNFDHLGYDLFRRTLRLQKKQQAQSGS